MPFCICHRKGQVWQASHGMVVYRVEKKKSPSPPASIPAAVRTSGSRSAPAVVPRPTQSRGGSGKWDANHGAFIYRGRKIIPIKCTRTMLTPFLTSIEDLPSLLP